MNESARPKQVVTLKQVEKVENRGSGSNAPRKYMARIVAAVVVVSRKESQRTE